MNGSGDVPSLAVAPTRGRGRPAVEWIPVWILAAVAYLPALASMPGKVPADTKLYLYLDPARLVSDAPWSWDNRQFAGWVPHQTIGYLWPSGPWYVLAGWMHLPDWVAQRLWVGTILFLAGLGVRWCARRMGLSPWSAFVAALAYQLSPYTLAYISRTSVLLLPWAGLGWLIGVTIGAARRGGWRDPALFALIVASVGGINATAMAMVAPAPLLWLADSAARREIGWRRALAAAARIGVLSVAVSLWWLVALAVQARYGAAVLNYSETLASVSFTSSAGEALRGLGYWLFYVRDPGGPLTTMALDYQVSSVVIGAGFLIIGTGIAGIVLVRWRARRFAAVGLFVAVVLAVGVHPIGDPSPLARPLAGSPTSTLTLALRSSTRALPLALLCMALGAGALLDALAGWRPRRVPIPPWLRLQVIAGALIVAAVYVNFPPLRHRQLVDPVLAHPQQMPAAWRQVAADLDSAGDAARVLQLPGTESAVARWGQTVDPVLPGLSTRDVVQRDWLPLGSAPAMDLFYALDDRFQSGTIEPAAIAPVARLFGADAIVFAGDVAFERFRTARPELSWSLYSERPPGLGTPRTYGPFAVDSPPVPVVDSRSLGDPRIGTPVPQVALIPVDDARPAVRAASGEVLVSGSGDGVVAAAAAGLLDGTVPLRYTAALDDDALAQASARAALTIWTDTNRKQAHRWSGSQDVLGYTEGADEQPLVDDAADHRLPVFPEMTTADQTVAEQRGEVAATATGYGEAGAYLPEDRPVMAIDGDPATAWKVAGGDDARGQMLVLSFAQPRAVGELTVVQPAGPANRWITEIDVRTDTGTRRVTLDERSHTPAGQPVAVGTTTRVIGLEIVATDPGERDTYFGLDPVGFAEVRVDDLPPTEEVIRLPTRHGSPTAEDPLAIVLERWRIDPSDRARHDPERQLVRSLTLPTARLMTPIITVRLDPNAPDTVLASVLGVDDAPTASTRLTGFPTAAGWAAVDGDPSTAWTTAFGQAAGASLTIPLSGVTTVGSLTLRIADDAQHDVPTELTLSAGGSSRTVSVPRPAAPGEPVTVTFEPLTGDSLQLVVSATEGRTTVDLRHGEAVGLPVAIAEVTIAGRVPVTVPQRVDTGCRDDLLSVDDVPVPLRVNADTADLLAGRPVSATPCAESSWALAAGEHVVRSTAGITGGIDVDRVVLRSGEPRVVDPVAGIERSDRGRDRRTITVGACPTGCWLTTGDGWNPGWQATIGGASLGAPELLDGGFSGWWLEPAEQARTVVVRWSPQRAIWLGLALSVLTVVACLVLALRTRGGTGWPDDAPAPPAFDPPWRAGGRPWAVVVIGTVLAALVVDPAWSIPVAVLSAAAVVARRVRAVGLAGLAVIAWVGAYYVDHQRAHRPLPGFGWVRNVEITHRPVLFALVLVLCAVLSDPGGEPRPGQPATVVGGPPVDRPPADTLPG